jgi:hypothetical protein
VPLAEAGLEFQFEVGRKCFEGMLFVALPSRHRGPRRLGFDRAPETAGSPKITDIGEGSRQVRKRVDHPFPVADPSGDQERLPSSSCRLLGIVCPKREAGQAPEH